jgi:DNA mismatch endonuclease, patch repair protein
MADVFPTRKRSQIMSRIRSRNNKATELALAHLLRCHGISGWRRGTRLFGRPDFVFHEERLALFVDGCFWHCCPKHGSQPSNNRAFWRAKLARNQARDRLVTRTLKEKGWKVLRVWQHELSRPLEERLVRRIQGALEQKSRKTRRAKNRQRPETLSDAAPHEF